MADSKIRIPGLTQKDKRKIKTEQPSNHETEIALKTLTEKISDPELDDFMERMRSPLSFELWVEYYDEVEMQLGKLGDYETVKDFASKSAENAARLAGNFHVFTYGPHGEIAADTMRRAIDIARWHLNETRRIFMALEQPDDVPLAQALWEWIEAKGQTTVTLTEMLQYGPHKLRNRASRDIALRKLIEHGYLTEITDGKHVTYQPCKRN